MWIFFWPHLWMGFGARRSPYVLSHPGECLSGLGRPGSLRPLLGGGVPLGLGSLCLNLLQCSQLLEETAALLVQSPRAFALWLPPPWISFSPFFRWRKGLRGVFLQWCSGGSMLGGVFGCLRFDVLKCFDIVHVK